MTTSTPSTPVSTAILASSIWHLIWVKILLFNPNLQMASQSRLLCSEAAGEVNSIYSTPKSDKAVAILILVSVSKKALANYNIMNGQEISLCGILALTEALSSGRRSCGMHLPKEDEWEHPWNCGQPVHTAFTRLAIIDSILTCSPSVQAQKQCNKAKVKCR